MLVLSTCYLHLQPHFPKPSEILINYEKYHNQHCCFGPTQDMIHNERNKFSIIVTSIDRISSTVLEKHLLIISNLFINALKLVKVMGVICIVAVMQTQYKCLGIHIINLHENHLLKALSFFKDLENPLITLEMVDASKEATSDSAFSNKKRSCNNNEYATIF